MSNDEFFDQNREAVRQRTLASESDGIASAQQSFAMAQEMRQDVLGATVCPHCGAPMDADADFCESCHHYARVGVCSFCGTSLSEDEAFCHECGNPRKGITCPVCHTVNEFSFCRQCGTPLTVEAQHLLEEVRHSPEYKKLEDRIHQLDALNNQLPYRNERDRVREEAGEKLRMTVLRLLAEDKGQDPSKVEAHTARHLSMDELAAKKQEILEALTAMFDKMALKPMASPIKARNYAMAAKPAGVRLAWVCNYKHAMHSSPCGCAKPQLGGKWVVLDKNSLSQLKDDK